MPLNWLVRRRRPAAGGYIDCRSTVREAARAGLSVTDYVERWWNQEGCTAEVVKKMLAACEGSGLVERVVEIGPGTGRYLEAVLATHPGAVHEICETADDWARFLKTFPHVVRPGGMVTFDVYSENSFRPADIDA
jgi:hypothetical protein